MGEVFGGDEFRIIIDDFVPAAHLAHSELCLRLVVDDWELGKGVGESFGVVVPRLINFGRDAPARHWAPFAHVKSDAEVLDLVSSFAFGIGPPLEGAHRWDVASALARNSLSALFDYSNFGVQFAVSVRSAHHETVIVRGYDGGVRAHEVGVQTFDGAIETMAAWAASVTAHQTGDNGSSVDG